MKTTSHRTLGVLLTTILATIAVLYGTIAPASAAANPTLITPIPTPVVEQENFDASFRVSNSVLSVLTSNHVRCVVLAWPDSVAYVSATNSTSGKNFNLTSHDNAARTVAWTSNHGQRLQSLDSTLLNATFKAETAGTATFNVYTYSNDSCTENMGGPASFNRTISPGPDEQTITFGDIADTAISAGPVTYSATASSGLDVTVKSTTETTCTINAAENEVNLLAAGTCTLEATQAGNADYLPVIAQKSFQVLPDKTEQTIMFDDIPDTVITAGLVSYNTSSTSGLPVTVVTLTPGICEVNSLTETVSLLTVGTCTLEAGQGGNVTYLPAANVQETFEVTPPVVPPVDPPVIVPPIDIPENPPTETPAGPSIGSNSHHDQIMRLYLVLFGRPGDEAGVQYWSNLLEHRSLSFIAKQFLASTEWKKGYSLTGEAYINHLYVTGLERNPDMAGKTYWMEQLNEGKETLSTIAAKFANSTELKNKLSS